MNTTTLDRVTIATLAAHYADGVVLALRTVGSEQELREGLAGAFLAFHDDVTGVSEE